MNEETMRAIETIIKNGFEFEAIRILQKSIQDELIFFAAGSCIPKEISGNITNFFQAICFVTTGLFSDYCAVANNFGRACCNNRWGIYN